MAIVTKILGDAPGIQYGGPQDNTETVQGNAGFAGLHVGQFKHGRLDRPMKIEQGNIRRLGYQPNNPDYQAVQDLLDLGVPFVWVQRVVAVEEV